MAKSTVKRPPARPSQPVRTEQKTARGHFPLSPHELAMAALLFCTTLVAYWPALNGGMLWDDEGHVTRASLRSLHGLWRIWFDVGASQQYYPLLHSAFWLEHKAWGDAVLGYHLTNVVLHAAAACLVVAIVKRLSLPGAWLAGFLFALHPVCVESVAWIAEQKSTLSAVFYLASALTYLYFDQTRKRSHYLIALALFVLALLSKSVTATLPAALLVIFWWKRGRLAWDRDILPLLPWFAIGAAAGLFTAWVERTYIGAQGTDYTLSLLQRFLLAGRIIWFYLAKLIWPANLMFFYPHWTIDTSAAWQYLFPLALIAALAGLASLARRHRGPLAAFLFFIGTLFPALGFFNVYPFVYSFVADHFQYLASLGIIVPLAAVITIAARRAPLASALPIALLAVLTWREAHMYKDVETLYRESIARNPGSWIAHNNLGNHLLDPPVRLNEAIEHLKTALRLKPTAAEGHNNLGSAYSRVPGRLPEAIAEYRIALKLNPNLALAHVNLGSALSKTTGSSQEALEHLETAVRLKPDMADAHNNLGVALAAIPGRTQDAINEYQTALELDPDSAEAHDNLAVALAKQPGHMQDALAEYQVALSHNPNSAEAHSNLGSALAETGRLPEAIEHLQTSLRLNPDSADAHLNLGIAYAKMEGRTPDAIAQYEAALRIKPDFADAHNNLGSLLAQAGRIKEAIPHFEAASRANPDSLEAHMNLGNALEEIPGRIPEAVAEYETAVRLDPNRSEPHYYLGLLLARNPARSAEAISQFEAALRIKPDPEVQQLVDGLRRVRR